SHILSEVERLADKVAIIRQGKIVESGSLEELRHLTRSTVTLITEQDVAQMANVEGVYDFEQNNNQATFSADPQDRKSTRLNSSHVSISYAVFCLKKKNN